MNCPFNRTIIFYDVRWKFPCSFSQTIIIYVYIQELCSNRRTVGANTPIFLLKRTNNFSGVRNNVIILPSLAKNHRKRLILCSITTHRIKNGANFWRLLFFFFAFQDPIYRRNTGAKTQNRKKVK